MALEGVVVTSNAEFRIELALLLQRPGNGKICIVTKNTDKLVSRLLRVFYFCDEEIITQVRIVSPSNLSART